MNSDSATTGLENSVLLDLYRTMQLVRRTELQLAKSSQQGLVHGACHTYVGQEAVAAGVCAHLRSEDAAFSTHRGHGHALAKGMPPEQLIAELYGRQTGCSAGRGGSMHLFGPEVGMMGTSGIVGPSMLQAVGAGYSFKLLKLDGVSVAFFGDGAVNNGAFHEALNLASIWDLPVLFVCENNGYATEVPFSYACSSSSVAARGKSYGLPGVAVDGNDVLAVYQAAAEAVKRARGGEGPTLLECVTYRVRSHAEGMVDFTYRTREEVDSWKKQCPLLRLRQGLVKEKVPSDSVWDQQLDAIDQEVADRVAAAHEAAAAAPYPGAETASEYIYAVPNVAVGQGARLPSHPAGEREITYVEATLEALGDAMDKDPTIFVLGEGVGERGGNFNTTTGLYQKYGPVRLCDTPICERGFVGLSAGAAMTGTRPVIDFMFADFILDAIGEILNQIAKIQYMSNGRLEMPVLLRGCIGIGHSAATHHSGSYYSMYGHFPGLRVVVPSTPYDAKGLLAHALTASDPVIFLEHRELMNIKGPVPEGPYEIPFGKAAVVCEGADVTIVALAEMVRKSMAAIKELQSRGISVELIDPRTVAPLDCETILQSVAKTGRLLIADETFEPYGIGAEISAQVSQYGFDDLDAPIHRLNGAHTPTPYSPALEKTVIPQVEDIVQAVLDLLEE
ncbi:MAG: dehydrogenase E1 component subunit alpha/beta [Pirellulales bacterium]|nr:dehydrogenase E1 component subunit alpha/beta [Pirellulales bacterium]